MPSPFPSLSFKVGISLFRSLDDAMTQACEQAKTQRRRGDFSPVDVLKDGVKVAEAVCTADAVEPVVRTV